MCDTGLSVQVHPDEIPARRHGLASMATREMTDSAPGLLRDLHWASVAEVRRAADGAD
jgi:mannose-6-phosphate isomerase class I